MKEKITDLLTFLIEKNKKEAIIAIDTDYKIVYVNNIICQATNKDCKKILNKSFLEEFYGGIKYTENGDYTSQIIEAIDTNTEKKYLKMDKKKLFFLPDFHCYEGYIMLRRDEVGNPKYAIACYSIYNNEKYLENKLMYMNSQFIHAMVTALDVRDNPMGRHSISVAELAAAFAWYLGLAKKNINKLYLIGLVHDIGKIGVPEAILRKPSRLTIEEYCVVKKHSSIGANILEDIESFQDIADIVRHHHESYDGTGYPDRLKGKDIPFFSRIIAICDAFDAMTVERCYRKKGNIASALDELLANRWTQFDPDLVLQFVDFIKQYNRA